MTDKRLGKVVFVDEIPKNPSGKVRRSIWPVTIAYHYITNRHTSKQILRRLLPTLELTKPEKPLLAHL